MTEKNIKQQINKTTENYRKTMFKKLWFGCCCFRDNDEFLSRDRFQTLRFGLRKIGLPVYGTSMEFREKKIGHRCFIVGFTHFHF